MPTLEMERHLNAPVEKVFDFVSKTEHLVRWWGPEGLHVPEHDLSLDRLGPWFSVMVNGEGQRFKVSGQVTHVDPPKSIGFTWAWHDEDDARGVESHVRIKLVPAQNGTVLHLSHVDLPEETAESHEGGWASTFNKLEALLAN